MMIRRRTRSCISRDERGATAVLVALLFGTFVITGLLAWSVDAGQVFWERRQTQNAADAGAMALAQSCAKNNCVVDANELKGLVNANTVNNGARTHTIERQCLKNGATGLVTTLLACSSTPSVSELRECPPLPTGVLSTLPYVEVRVQANETSSGLIPNPFARLNDTDKDDDSNVVSCARAAWGIPAANNFTAPIAISTCEWNTFTNGGLTYYPPPTGSWPGYGSTGQSPWPLGPTTPSTAGREIVIKLHDPGAAECPAGPSGGDSPGGFGYLDTASGCIVGATATNGVDYWAGVSTGSSAPNPCRSVIADLRDNGPVVDLPIFDCIVNNGSGAVTAAMDCSSGSGSSATYHLLGVARFYISGYQITGSDTRPSRVTGAVPCSGSVRCISGWFVSGVISTPHTGVVAPSPTHPGFGLSVVVPAG